jgi:hypothetical protein
MVVPWGSSISKALFPFQTLRCGVMRLFSPMYIPPFSDLGGLWSIPALLLERVNAELFVHVTGTCGNCDITVTMYDYL